MPDTSERLEQLRIDVEFLKEGHKIIGQSQSVNHNELLALRQDTKEIIEFSKTVSEGLKILVWLAKVVKWATAFITFCAAAIGLYHVTKGGEFPKLP